MTRVPDPLAAIRDGFFVECDDLLEGLQDALARIGAADAGQAPVDQAFRAVHSIKGGAAAFGLGDLAAFAHGLESHLALLRGPGAAPAAGTGPLQRAADHLAGLVDAARAGRPAPAPGTPILAALSEPPTGTLADGAVWQVVFRPGQALYVTGHEPLHLLNALADMGATQIGCDWAGLPPLTDLAPEEGYLCWRLILPGHLPETEIRGVFEFAEDLCDLSVTLHPSGAPLQDTVPHDVPATAPAPSGIAPATDTATLRVDLGRVDRLMNLIGELTIGHSMLAQSLCKQCRTDRHSPASAALDALGSLIGELQEAAITIRSQSLKPLFQRMSRVLREASAAVGKPADLICIGEHTEVDRNIIERLAEPLTHMIRNAVDHGLEPPVARAAAGKPDTGRVTLSATQRSGRIVIELADDGGGIDRARVRQIAIARGLITPDAGLDDDATDALLFRPGFSTSQDLTMLSGRGVGLDVVRTAILALGGRISIRSAPGSGTTFSLSLPLTLAVLDGMIVRSHGQTFVVPQAAVLETGAVAGAAMRRLESGQSLIRLRDQFVSLCDLGAVFALASPPDSGRRAIAILLGDEDGRRAALIVDEIVDTRQVVIKGIGQNCGHFSGIMAATILGDGAVALIVDPTALISLAARHAGNGRHRSPPVRVPA